eukprot:GHVS01014868.1.p1 GENE.GHVS01014868.1~~GHVS01014868.1.p1  ORF type:complete len:210 (+),score=8.81 GHVS01014868.1:423-1052(+)
MDEKVLSDFVRQGKDNYSRYRNGLHLHNAIFGINTKLDVTEYKCEAVKHGILSLRLADINVSTVTSAEAGEEDIMEIFIELGLDGDKQFIYGFTYKLHVNTSEITPNCTLTSDEDREMKDRGLNVRKAMDKYFENECNMAAERVRPLESDGLVGKALLYHSRHEFMAGEVTCTVAYTESRSGKMKIGFLVNYPQIDNVDFSYDHVQKCE